MTIFAVDDAAMALKALERAIREAAPEAAVRCFSGADAALSAAHESSCDAAFLDIRMPGMDGLELAGRLKRLHPRVNIIFVTAHDEYMARAFALHASGYLSKPVSPEDVRRELDDLRYPAAPREKRVRFQTFGNFEAFIDGDPVRFRRSKTKELLAYLVDRGTLCSNADIIAALWPENISGSYFRTLRKDLFDTFSDAGCAGALIRRRDRQGVRAEAVSCDYYDWKRGLPQALSAYQGEYMTQYSWAEFTHGMLVENFRHKPRGSSTYFDKSRN